MTSNSKFPLLFEWLQQKGFEEEIDILCESVLRYLSAYDIIAEDEGHNYISDLIDYCNSITSPSLDLLFSPINIFNSF